MRANPQAQVTLNFASSSQLSEQIKQGAPVQIAAFADLESMTELSAARLILEPAQAFARNQLALVTQSNAKDKVSSLAELADLADVSTIAMCVVTAPCGKYAEQALATAGVRIPESRITRGTDASTTLRAVTEGDAVAGIVYVTDALAALSAQGSPNSAQQVLSVPIDAKYNVDSTYWIAQVGKSTDDSNNALSRAFIEFILSKPGQKFLSQAGFLLP